MPERMNVESFNLDHRAVAAPFVRVADVKRLPDGDVLTKYDVRFCQPNREHLEMTAVHSIEHSFAECVRNHSDAVIDFGPMGCQTGFYLIMVGEPDVPATRAPAGHRQGGARRPRPDRGARGERDPMRLGRPSHP